MKNKVEQDEFKKYLEEARTWESDKIQQLQGSKKVAWIIASVASCIAFMAISAVVLLVPLKTVEPYVIRVDNSTGMVDVVTSMKEGKTNYDETVNKYFTQLYIRYREGYSKELAEEYYKNVGIMSASAEQQKYSAFFNPKNPLSPLKIYGDTGKIKINIKGTTFIKPNIALVRYTKEVTRGSEKPQLTHFTATVTFKYAGKSKMAETDRAINPLAFQVIEYRNDPDSAPITKPDLTPTQLPTSQTQTVIPDPIPTQAPEPVADTTPIQGESR